MRNNPFQTGRTFDPVGRGLAQELVTEVQDSPEWIQLLLDVATGDAEPRDLPQKFQDLLEAAYESRVGEQGSDAGDSKRKEEQEARVIA